MFTCWVNRCLLMTPQGNGYSAKGPCRQAKDCESRSTYLHPDSDTALNSKMQTQRDMCFLMGFLPDTPLVKFLLSEASCSMNFCI